MRRGPAGVQGDSTPEAGRPGDSSTGSTYSDRQSSPTLLVCRAKMQSSICCQARPVAGRTQAQRPLARAQPLVVCSAGNPSQKARDTSAKAAPSTNAATLFPSSAAQGRREVSRGGLNWGPGGPGWACASGRDRVGRVGQVAAPVIRRSQALGPPGTDQGGLPAVEPRPETAHPAPLPPAGCAGHPGRHRPQVGGAGRGARASPSSLHSCSRKRSHGPSKLRRSREIRSGGKKGGGKRRRPPPARAPRPEPAPPPPGRRCADVLPPDELSRTVRAVILAGGETKNPLSKYRAMPAVPIGGWEGGCVGRGLAGLGKGRDAAGLAAGGRCMGRCVLQGRPAPTQAQHSAVQRLLPPQRRPSLMPRRFPAPPPPLPPAASSLLMIDVPLNVSLSNVLSPHVVPTSWCTARQASNLRWGCARPRVAPCRPACCPLFTHACAHQRGRPVQAALRLLAWAGARHVMWYTPGARPTLAPAPNPLQKLQIFFAELPQGWDQQDVRAHPVPEPHAEQPRGQLLPARALRRPGQAGARACAAVCAAACVVSVRCCCGGVCSGVCGWCWCGGVTGCKPAIGQGRAGQGREVDEARQIGGGRSGTSRAQVRHRHAAAPALAGPSPCLDLAAEAGQSAVLGV